VKYSPGAFRDGCEPLRETMMRCEASVDSVARALINDPSSKRESGIVLSSFMDVARDTDERERQN
jgi:hypothetical protein